MQQSPKTPSQAEVQASVLDASRHIVTNAVKYRDRPMLRRMAWMALMEERGKVCNQAQLAKMPVQS